jgi:hypothetical protein
MNRQERHAAGKGLSDERIDVSGIVVHFANGQYINLDMKKAQIVDRETGRPVFEEVLEPVPKKIEDIQATHSSSDSAASLPKKPRHDEFVDEQKPQKEDYVVAFDTPEGRMEYVKKGNWSGVRPTKGV